MANQNEYRRNRYSTDPEYAERQREKQRRYVRNNPETAKDSIRKALYGVPHGWYAAQYALQQGRCAICRRFFEVLHIDHNHDTGEVRELLCSQCNKGLGGLQDSIEILRRATEYLDKHNTRYQTKTEAQ